MRKLWGRLLCRWKGKHVERRVVGTRIVDGDTCPDMLVLAYNRECSRCGARRLAPQRKKAAA